MQSVFVNRIIRACKLEVSLYEEVEADKSATLQAALVVVLSSLAAGVGALSMGASNFLMAPILSLISWYIWAYLIYFIGAKLFPEPNTKADHGELLRTIGFSSAPGLIRVFGFTPELMTITFIGGGIWMLVAMVIGVRQALDYESTWRTIGVVIIVTGFLFHKPLTGEYVFGGADSLSPSAVKQGIELAEEESLDLVEISPKFRKFLEITQIFQDTCFTMKI